MNRNAQLVRLPEGSEALIDKPFEVAPIKTDTADEAYRRVLAGVGAILPKRDSVDQRILKDVRERTGRLIDSQADVGGWPELRSEPAPSDGDSDGMPDVWEKANGFNPNDASDGQKPGPETEGYTALESYLNHLARKAWAPAVEK